MSSPHPEGAGARAAMLQALQRAGLQPTAIDYINLHGTGTQSNDSSESRAVGGIFGANTAASSTKRAAGLALGAAGALEALICALALQHEFMPAGVNTKHLDTALKVHYLRENRAGRL